MSESFPNPFDPPAVPPPRALESTDEDAELSRALQESLAFEKAECERRRMAEDEALEAAIRASHEEETRRMHDKEKRERQEQEILERSRAEAFREQRRREAERQRYALLEMEVMEQSRREHEARMRYNSSHVPEREPSDVDGAMESLHWLGARNGSTASAGSSPATVPGSSCTGACTPGGSGTRRSSSVANNSSMAPAGVSAPQAPYNDAPPLYDDAFPNPYAPPTQPPASQPLVPQISTSGSPPLQVPPIHSANAARAAAPPPTEASPLSPESFSSEGDSPILVPKPPQPRSRSRYEELFGTADNDEEPDDDEPYGASSLVSTQAPPAEHDALAPTAPLLSPLEATAEPQHCEPKQIVQPSDFQGQGVDAWRNEALAPNATLSASHSPSTETHLAGFEEPGMMPYPPEWADGQPALRGVQFGLAAFPYALELCTPSGAALYALPDLPRNPALPASSNQLSLYFPPTITLGDAKRPWFVLRAYSWKVLLQAMAWFGQTTLCGRGRGGQLQMELGVSVPRKVESQRHAADAFRMPSLVTLALGLVGAPGGGARALDAYCSAHQATFTEVSLAAHPLSLPTDLVTLAQTLFSAPQLSNAVALRELRHAITRQDEWIEARRAAVEACPSSDPDSVLEQRFLAHQLSLLMHPTPAPSASAAPTTDALVDGVPGSHRDHLRQRVKKTLARWNTTNVAPEEDLAAWVTPYHIGAEASGGPDA